MATKIIALDAGHGLKTAGKQTPDGIKEWTLNDKVRDKVVDMLKDYDVEFIFPDNNEGDTDEGLTARRSMYVNQKADVAVSIHHNAYTGKWNSATGVEVFVDRNCTTADQKLAECIYPKLVANTGMKGRGIKKANWTVINQNTIPAVLTEGGFMDGKKDYPIITSDAGQTAYAKAIADGLIEFLSLKKKTTTSTSPATSASTFKVKFKEEMNVRTGAGTKYPAVNVCKKNYIYTIVDTTKVGTALWGKLKSGAGWVCIANKYCDRVDDKVSTPATPTTKPATPTTNDCPFTVKFKEDMNVRTGAGTKNPIVKKNNVCKKNYKYTIIETTKVGTTPWGKLKSGAGWVCIAAKYCDRV